MATMPAHTSSSRRVSSTPSSPRFFQPKPSTTPLPTPNVFSLHSRVNAATPRPQSPQESTYFTNMNAFGYPSPKSPTSPLARPIGSFSPYLRHLSPTPSSGVSSVQSMSENESSDEELILSPVKPNTAILLPDPESEDEAEAEIETKEDISEMDPSQIHVMEDDSAESVFSSNFSGSANPLAKSSIITIEELPALPESPALSRTNSTGSNVSSHLSSHVSWQETGIEIICGEYSSCASSSEFDDTTDDPQTEDDDYDEFEWNVDVTSSSYPTDDFLLGGFLGLSTSSGPMGGGVYDPYNISNRPATPFAPRAFVKRTYTSPFSSDAFEEKKNGTIKRRTGSSGSISGGSGNGNGKKRRIYDLFADEGGEGDDESDEADGPDGRSTPSGRSPAKKAKSRMSIDTVMSGRAHRRVAAGGKRRSSLSQMFGITMADNMDLDL